MPVLRSDTQKEHTHCTKDMHYVNKDVHLEPNERESFHTSFQLNPTFPLPSTFLPISFPLIPTSTLHLGRKFIH